MKLEQAIQSNKFKSEAQKAGVNIMYTAWWLKTISLKELKVFGLTHEQYNVLRILKGKYPEQMCVKDVANRMIEKNSNVPRIIDRLEDKKLVKRTVCNKDARQTDITLTQAGVTILDSATTKLNQVWFKFICMDNASALQLNNLLEQFRQAEG